MNDSELRVAVGTRGGVQSCVWKIWTTGNHAYLSCASYAGQEKVSLHEDGRSQWSTDAVWWGRNSPGKPNRERHHTKWNTALPIPGEPVSAFRLLFPFVELRPPSVPPDNSKEILWIGAPSDSPDTICVQLIHCADPAEAQALPETKRLLKVLPFANGGVLLAICETAAWSEEDMGSLRETLAKEARPFVEEWRACGHEPGPSMRGHLFIDSGPVVGPGFFEFAVEL